MLMQPTVFINEVLGIDLVDLALPKGLVQFLIEHDLLRDHSSHQAVPASKPFDVRRGEEMRQLTEIVRGSQDDPSYFQTLDFSCGR